MSFDYRPLFAPVAREDVARFTRESRATGQPWAHSTPTAKIVSVVVGTIMAIIVLGIVSTTLPVITGTFASDSGETFWTLVVCAVIVLVIAGLAVYRSIMRASGTWESLYRRTRFASANELMYLTGLRNPPYPGLIFSQGDSRQTTNGYRSTSAPEFDLGNFSYTTGSGKDKTTHHWGYLALRLERRVPHMVLDSRDNNGLLGGSSLPVSFRRDQKLSLEGDFDNYFTLYCPREYERDALYVFTPDLMALLIDASAAFDVEVVDDWMFVYSITPLALDEAKSVHRFLRIVETVGAKTLRQTDRYADERIGDIGINVVAPQGQRLKKDATFTSIGAVLVIAIGWVAFSFLRFWL